MNKVKKLLVIFCMTFGICYLAYLIGPAKHSAEAKIFDRLFVVTQNMPAYLFDEQNTSSPRKVLVNNMTTWLAVTKTNDSIEEILDFYSAQYKQQLFIDVPDEIFESVKDERLLKQFAALEIMSFLLSQSQHFVQMNDDYGFLGMIEYHDQDIVIGGEKWVEAMNQVVETGEFGKMCTGRVVIAFKGPGGKNGTVLNLWTDRDFNFNNLQPDFSGDIPGFDIDNVPRFHTNKRKLSIEQENKSSRFRLVQYEGEGSVAAHIVFLHNRLESEGWTPDSIFDSIGKKFNTENTMYYVREGRQCTIHLEKDQNSGKIRTTVVENTPKSA